LVAKSKGDAQLYVVAPVQARDQMANRRSHDEEDMAAWLGATMIDQAEFERRRGELSAGGPEGRARADSLSLGRTALAMAGELGYQQVRVDELIVRAGSNRVRFYDAFIDKEACFTWAYDAAVDALCERLLGACTEPEAWAAGMRGGLVALSAFLAGEPEVARGLLAEPGGAGNAVAAKRAEFVERLAEAVDRARRERDEPRHPLPPLTARFIVGGIQAAAIRSLNDPVGRSFEEALPGLLFIAVDYYLGPEAARAEVRALRPTD
jgi:AcrR family transcriptional regulator